VPFVVYQFGDFSLHCGKFELCRKGRRLKLERKPLELLVLLVTKHGQVVTRDEIAGRLWEREVFVDIEHGINTAIRKIRQILGDSSDLPQFVLTISGSGYRFIAPVTAVQQEVTGPTQPSGDPVDLPPAPPKISAAPVLPSPARPRHRLWLVAALCAFLLITISIVTLGPHPLAARFLDRDTHAIASLAVLPLDNLSGDPGQEYFADGMTDELTTMLAKDSTLRIVSRTSVMQYKKARRPLPEIAQALHVDAILEGSVARSGSQVHMTLQLIRADTDSHMWAESYDRDANALALPDEAARAIAKQLHSSVPAAAVARYVNPQAHDAWLRGRYLWFRDRNDEAGQYFRKATEIQPDYAPAWAGMSDYYGVGAVEAQLDPRSALPAMEDAAAKAVQLDPSLPEAHLAMGAAFYFHRWDWAGADREILRAIALDPRFGEPWHLRAKLLSSLNRYPEAIEAQKMATELDPFERPWALVLAYEEARRYDAALEEARLHMETDAGSTDLLAITADTWRSRGSGKEAAEYWEKFFTALGDPQSAAAIQHAYRAGGYPAVVRWQISAWKPSDKNHYVSPVELAGLHAQLGRREPTLSLLEEGYRQHSPGLLWIQSDPAYDFLHNDPRYRALIQEIGLPPAY
jgi:TolB-like protein/DNA-binding winged helix-turn-helix (wHTH) protein